MPVSWVPGLKAAFQKQQAADPQTFALDLVTNSAEISKMQLGIDGNPPARYEIREFAKCQRDVHPLGCGNINQCIDDLVFVALVCVELVVPRGKVDRDAIVDQRMYVAKLVSPPPRISSFAFRRV